MAQKELELKISYDTKSDVLYCSFGDPRDAISVETDDGVVIRLDPQTQDVVGVTVLDFSKRFIERPESTLSFPFRHALRLAAVAE